MELVETGEKRDRVGRKITSASRREELVGAWQHSGLTQAEFARQEGVRYPTFASWVQQQRAAKRTPPSAVAKVRFAEVQLPATVGMPPVEVRLADGTLVRGASVREVLAVVRALRG
jgi:transposase-like protein